MTSVDGVFEHFWTTLEGAVSLINVFVSVAMIQHLWTKWNFFRITIGWFHLFVRISKNKNLISFSNFYFVQIFCYRIKSWAIHNFYNNTFNTSCMTEQKIFHDDADQGWMTATYIVKQVEACCSEQCRKLKRKLRQLIQSKPSQRTLSLVEQRSS